MRQRRKRGPWPPMVSLLLLIGLTACSEDDGPKDLRLLTPQTTVHTLLDAYGVLEVPQAEIDRRMELGRRFHLNDPDARRLVFHGHSRGGHGAPSSWRRSVSMPAAGTPCHGS